MADKKIAELKSYPQEGLMFPPGQMLAAYDKDGVLHRITAQEVSEALDKYLTNFKLESEPLEFNQAYSNQCFNEFLICDPVHVGRTTIVGALQELKYRLNRVNDAIQKPEKLDEYSVGFYNGMEEISAILLNRKSKFLNVDNEKNFDIDQSKIDELVDSIAEKIVYAINKKRQ